jgi:outer membrane protein, heavy metal efflux system
MLPVIQKISLCIVIAGFLAGVADFARGADEKVISLNEVVTMALRANPELQAAQAKYQASRERVRSAYALPDPWVGFEYWGFPQGSMDSAGIEQKMYTFTQEIPWPGKLSLRSKIAASSADITNSAYQNKVREIIKQVKQSYADLFFAYKAIEINKKNNDILAQMVKISESKYQTGKASLVEVLKIKVELAKLNNDLLTLQNQKQIAQAKLDNLLNRKSADELGQPVYAEEKDFPYQEESLLKLAQEQRPELNAARSGIHQSDLNLSLTKREYLPDFMVSYKQRVQAGQWMGWDGMLSFTIPLWFWQKQGNMVAEMQAEKKMATADYQAMENEVIFEVRQAYLKAESSWRRVNLSRDTVVPQSEQVLRLTQAAYETDKAGFLEVLDSRRMYQDEELDYYRGITEYQMAKAELEQMVGTDLQ